MIGRAPWRLPVDARAAKKSDFWHKLGSVAGGAGTAGGSGVLLCPISSKAASPSQAFTPLLTQPYEPLLTPALCTPTLGTPVAPALWTLAIRSPHNHPSSKRHNTYPFQCHPRRVGIALAPPHPPPHTLPYQYSQLPPNSAELQAAQLMHRRVQAASPLTKQARTSMPFAHSDNTSILTQNPNAS